MTQPFEVADDGHARFVLHAGDEALAATGDDNVEAAIEAGEDVPDGGAVGGLHQLDRVFGQADFGKARTHGVGNNARGVEALRAAAQDHRVGGAQAKCAGISRHVRAALIDDADDADGHAHARESETVGLGPVGQHCADRIGQASDVGHALRHRLDAGRREFETIEHGAADAFHARGVHVLCVGGEDLRRDGADAGGHGLEGGGARLRSGLGHGGGSSARGLTHGKHGPGEGGVVRGERQLDGHGRLVSTRELAGKLFGLRIVLLAEVLQRSEDGLEVAAFGCEHVFVARGLFGIEAAFEHSRLDERFQAAGQHVGRDAEACLELVEPG